MGSGTLTEQNPLRWPRYIFYRLAQWQSARGADMPVLNAFLLTALFLGINFWTIEGFASSICRSCDLLWPVLERDDFRTQRLILMVSVFAFFGLLYLRWIHADQYRKFFAEYGAETDASRRVGTVLVGAYILGTVLFYGLLFV